MLRDARPFAGLALHDAIAHRYRCCAAAGFGGDRAACLDCREQLGLAIGYWLVLGGQGCLWGAAATADTAPPAPASGWVQPWPASLSVLGDWWRSASFGEALSVGEMLGCAFGFRISTSHEAGLFIGTMLRHGVGFWGAAS